MSGGAGYVLSRETLRRLYEQAFPNETLCLPPDTAGPEDLIIG